MSGIRALPVLMFHSVAPSRSLAPHGWLERISEPVERFEAMLEDWKRRGVRTVRDEDRIRIPRRLRDYAYRLGLLGLRDVASNLGASDNLPRRVSQRRDRQ